jgi:hypothetical protein
MQVLRGFAAEAFGVVRLRGFTLQPSKLISISPS